MQPWSSSWSWQRQTHASVFLEHLIPPVKTIRLDIADEQSVLKLSFSDWLPINYPRPYPVQVKMLVYACRRWSDMLLNMISWAFINYSLSMVFKRHDAGKNLNVVKRTPFQSSLRSSPIRINKRCSTWRSRMAEWKLMNVLLWSTYPKAIISCMSARSRQSVGRHTLVTLLLPSVPNNEWCLSEVSSQFHKHILSILL